MLEPFHATSGRGVRQKPWTAWSLIAMARLFTNYALENFPSAAGKAPLLASFRDS